MRSLVTATAFLLSLITFAQGFTPAGLKYTNWDGLEYCSPIAGLLPSTESELVDAVKAAAARGDQFKVVGAGHSFSGIQLTDGNLTAPEGRVASLDLLTGITGTKFLSNGEAEVTVLAGTRLRDLNTALEEQGLALENLGACAAQSIAGAVATGTHGTGRELGSMSTQLRGLRIIDAQGEIHDTRFDDPETRDLFTAAQVGLGALGAVSAVTVHAVPLFKMKKTTFTMPIDEFLAQHDEFYANYSRFQWSWVPYSGIATVMLREETDDDITGCWTSADTTTVTAPVTAEEDNGTVCVDVSYKTLVDSNSAYPQRTLYTEQEMFIPVEFAVDAVKDFIAYQNKVRTTFEEMMTEAGDATTSLYSQVRYVKADNITMSPMHGRDVAVLSMIVQGDQDSTGNADAFALYTRDGLEKIAAESYEGVPHWGKKNWATASDLLPFFGQENFDFFESVRQPLDPNGIFLNSYLIDRGVGVSK